MISSERKHFELRIARHHHVTHGLSNMIVLHDGDSTQIGYIRFSGTFVDFVGMSLPRGVSEKTPSFISITHDPLREHWSVAAHYVGDVKSYPLWKSGIRPAWTMKCKPIPGNDHENNAPGRNPAGRTRTRTSEDSART